MGYQVRVGGNAWDEIEFFDVDARRILPDRLPLGSLRGFGFAPDGKGFYYVYQTAPDTFRPETRFHRFGARSEDDVLIWAVESDPGIQLMAGWTDDCRFGLYTVRRSGVRTVSEFYLHDLVSGAGPRLIHREEGRSTEIRLASGRLWMCTETGAPNRQISSAPLVPAPIAQSSWTTIVPERTARIQKWGVRPGLVFATYVEDLAARTFVWTESGMELGTVPYPGPGTGAVHSGGTRGSLYFNYQSFTESRSIYSWKPGAAKARLWWSSVERVSPEGAEVRRAWYQSKDGTRIHMFVVGRRETFAAASPTAPAPVVLTGYGAAGMAQTPQFSETAMFVVDNGGLFALANIRGGSEFGQEWHEAARGRKRQKAIDDFLGAAEWLCANYTQPRRLAVAGGSNSGTLVCAAMTQRPELFQCVLCFAPLLDMVRYPLFYNTQFYVDDLGSPDDPIDFATLLAYSPYHNVRKRVRYPAVYMLAGDADHRCDPMHARKMVARLQDDDAGQAAVILDYSEIRGHNKGMPIGERVQSLTNRWAFLCEQLRMEVKK
jgi:prolyl oligopeptidase